MDDKAPAPQSPLSLLAFFKSVYKVLPRFAWQPFTRSLLVEINDRTIQRIRNGETLKSNKLNALGLSDDDNLLRRLYERERAQILPSYVIYASAIAEGMQEALRQPVAEIDFISYIAACDILSAACQPGKCQKTFKLSPTPKEDTFDIDTLLEAPLIYTYDFLRQSIMGYWGFPLQM